MQRCSVQEVFVRGFEEYAGGRELHPRELAAARSISQCYTSALGAHIQMCPQGDYERLQYHACRHRSCPRCARDAQRQWVDSEMKRLLPCPHAHVIFTLPHRLLPLWEFNRAWFIGVLFDSARQSILELMRDPRRLGATPGILMNLHTWGRDLSHHPHVHCLVSAGGVDEQGKWRANKGKWVLPWRPLLELYRAKVLAALIDALQTSRLRVPPWTSQAQWREDLGRQYEQDWSVKVCPVYEHGRGVMLYLARYAKGGPLCGKLLQTDGRDVRMRYQDHRSGKRRWLQLPSQQFIRRVLWHAPPRGVHTTRHAGLYSTPWREQHGQAQAALGAASSVAPASGDQPCTETPTQTKPAQRCPHCGGPLLRVLLLRPRLRRSLRAGSGRANSITKAAATGPPEPSATTSASQAPKAQAAARGRCPTNR